MDHAERRDRAVGALELGLERRVHVGVIMGREFLAQRGELVRLAPEVLPEPPAEDGLLHRGRGGHLVEETLERRAEIRG